MAREEGKKFHVCAEVINWILKLDESNRIYSLRSGNVNTRTYLRDCFGKDEIDRNDLKEAFMYMLIAETEKFKELYDLLKENDHDMFLHANAVVHQIQNYCSELIKNE